MYKTLLVCSMNNVCGKQSIAGQLVEALPSSLRFLVIFGKSTASLCLNGGMILKGTADNPTVNTTATVLSIEIVRLSSYSKLN